MESKNFKEVAFVVFLSSLTWFSTRLLYSYWRKQDSKSDYTGDSTTVSRYSRKDNDTNSDCAFSSQNEDDDQIVVEDSASSTEKSNNNDNYITGNNLVINMNDEILAASH